MSDQVNEVVTEHTIQLAILSKSVVEIKDVLKDNNRALSKMADAMKSQELLMEKLANIESSYKGSVDRLHHRINDNESNIKKMDERLEKAEGTIKATCPVVDVNMQHALKRIGKLESIWTWVARITGTSILVALLGLVIKSAK